MASCQTSRWVSTAPYVKLIVEKDTSSSGSTGSTQKLNWTLQYIADYAASAGNRDYSVVIDGDTEKSGTFNINGKTGTHLIASGTKTINKSTAKQDITFKVSFEFAVTWSGVYAGTKTASDTIEIAAKTKYAIKYDANGGSGAPSTDYKWHGTAITLASTKPTRSGYTFQGWGTSASDTSVNYAAGASYSTNAALTLYAIWKKTITLSYDANGGSGAPSSQSATVYNATTNNKFTIPTTKPTRANYTFLGWSKSSSATTASYAAGSTITLSSSDTLYAVWKLSYVKPEITNLTVKRCTSGAAVADDGTYALVNFSWATFVNATSITIEWKRATVTTWSSSDKKTITPSGKSGTVNEVVGGGNLSIEYAYDIRVTVIDSQSSTPLTRTIASDAYLIDFSANEKEVAFFATADAEAEENRVRMNSQLIVNDYANLEGGYGGGYTAATGMTTLEEVVGGKAKFSSGTTGILKIVMPQDFGAQMVAFDVEIFSYTNRAICTYSFAGQIAKNDSTGVYKWSNYSFLAKGGSLTAEDLTSLPVSFGRHDGKAAVSIGTATTAWGLCSVVVKNFRAWYSGNVSTKYWADGWQILISASTLGEVLNTADVTTANYRSVTISGLPSGATYDCRYYPALGQCFLRLYYTGKAITAQSTTDIATVQSGYEPDGAFALAVRPTTGLASTHWARITSAGVIQLWSNVAKVADTDTYISGFWFV